MSEVLFWILFIAVLAGDVIAYTQAKWPERSGNLLYKMPLGGYLALWKFGRD